MWTFCPECEDVSVFEQPPCGDGHGGDCPEWFCVTCGCAVIEGEVQVIAMIEREVRPSARDTGRSARSA